MKGDMICLIYLDDTILCGPNIDSINKEINGLGVARDDQKYCFQLRDEEQVGDFLVIRIEKIRPCKINLTQTGLINKVLKASKMEECNAVPTPAAITPISIDKDGDPFDEEWGYTTVMGMLMYLAQNSRPDLAYVVHQCVRFTQASRESHVAGIKRVVRYLQGTKDKGLILNPTTNLQVNCNVYADFASL